MVLRAKLLRHFVGDHAAHGPTAKKIGPNRLHGSQRLNVAGRHVFNSRMGLLPFFETGRLEPIARLIGAEQLGQMDVGENMPTGRMDQEKRPFATPGLKRYQRRARIRLAFCRSITASCSTVAPSNTVVSGNLLPSLFAMSAKRRTA